MCGIAGIITKKISENHVESVERMLTSMIHRGPDGQGNYNDARICMGMRRLSIIDIHGGWQPLYNEDKSLVLIMNGEIYNYIELSEQLKKNGHIFSTQSDAEVILHLYEEYGEDCLLHLRGMFAFVLLDKNNLKVFIARDRMGEKPLYLYENNEIIYFSSEMKSLLASGDVPFALDPNAIDQFFHYQYVPEPKTPLVGVRKLPRAHYLTIDLTSWEIKQRKYWDLEEAAPVHGDPIELVREEFDKVCELIIRSDVPVGVALSGGLDSSAIAAVAAKKYPGTMNAFSVGYPGRPPNDERNSAKQLADILEMPLHEIELETIDLVRNFEQMCFQRDDPIADISGFGYYSVSKAANEHGVSVLLQGQGGDELFWGYQWVKDAAEATNKKSSQHLVKNNLSILKRFVRTPLKAFFRSSDNLEQKTVGYRPIFHELAPDFRIALSDMRNYYTDSFVEELGNSTAFDLFTFKNPWKYSDILITRLICDTYLIENGIAQGDRLSMTNSVELRLPFVDHKLVELVIGLRKTHQHNPDYMNFPKPWLRGALAASLPSFIIDRPKQGFAPPVQEWHKALFNAYGQYLDGGYLVKSGILTKEAGFFLSSGPFPHGAIAPISFKALVLEVWCREMIKITQKTG
jgi:asparagine synthase (glutamine-hydrolysing)